MRQVNQPVFISDDGREFTSEQDCKEWEAHYSKLKKNLAFFRVNHSPDLTEGRGMQRTTLFGVVADEGSGTSAETLLLHYLVENNKGVVTRWYCDAPHALWHHNKISELEFEANQLGVVHGRKIDKKYLRWSCKAGTVVEVTLEKLMEY